MGGSLFLRGGSWMAFYSLGGKLYYYGEGLGGGGGGGASDDLIKIAHCIVCHYVLYWDAPNLADAKFWSPRSQAP